LLEDGTFEGLPAYPSKKGFGVNLERPNMYYRKRIPHLHGLAPKKRDKKHEQK
jgi:hypothetical protein